MCQFTRVRYAMCGTDDNPHTTLLTARCNVHPCRAASLINMVQGLEAAPAYCHTLANDQETRIAVEHTVFGYCDDCKPVAVKEKLDDLKQLAFAERQEGKDHAIGSKAITYDQSDADELKCCVKRLRTPPLRSRKWPKTSKPSTKRTET
jgi:hypothetical protein